MVALVLVLVAVFPVTVRAEEYGGEFGEGLTWVLTEDGTLTISGNGVIPEFEQYFNPQPWYELQLKISRVVIEPGVTSIGHRAFEMCLNLTSVSLPEGLEYIGYRAFDYCLELKEIVIPEGVITLEEESFSNCTALTTVTLPGTLQQINKNCFLDCEALKSIEIPGSVKVVGACAFSGCTALERVVMGEGVEEIGYGAFQKCRALNDLTVPDTVRVIGEAAFSGCRALKSFRIPVGVTVIEPQTFASSGIVQITIPDTVTEIKYDAFMSCGSLIEIIIPDSVTKMGGGCFDDCDDLKQVQLSENLTAIAGGLFRGCKRLERVNIPDGVTVIYKEAFSGCEALTSVTIPDGCTVLNESAFKNCVALKQISIPMSVTEIGANAFAFCKALEDVYYPGSDRDWNDILVGSGNDYLLNANVHFGVAGHEHDYESEVIPARCMMDGYTVHTCFCGDSYTTDPTTALGHEFDGDVCVRCGARNVSSEFVDVTQNDYFSNSVTWAVEHGITAGTGNGKFSPNDPCTRGQVVTFLWRVMGNCVLYYPKTTFADVQTTDYFYDAVGWASRRGVTSGTGDGFSPNAPCTRGQVVTFLWRLMGREQQKDAVNPFTDVKEGDYYYHAVLWAVKNGITSGTSADTFSPDAICTRGQVVTFLGRTFKLDQLPQADKPYTLGHAWNDPGVYANVEGMEHPVYSGGTVLRYVTSEINTFTTKGYNFLRFFVGGIAVNDNERRGVAQIVQDEKGRFGIEIFQWRQDYEDTVGVFPLLNVVFEAMHYFTADWDIAYDLWRFVDDSCCAGDVDTTDYGFTDVEQTELGWIIARDDVRIEFDISVDGQMTFWFIY